LTHILLLWQTLFLLQGYHDWKERPSVSLLGFNPSEGLTPCLVRWKCSPYAKAQPWRGLMNTSLHLFYSALIYRTTSSRSHSERWQFHQDLQELHNTDYAKADFRNKPTGLLGGANFKEGWWLVTWESQWLIGSQPGFLLVFREGSSDSEALGSHNPKS
jgi:hypothetical protein